MVTLHRGRRAARPRSYSGPGRALAPRRPLALALGKTLVGCWDDIDGPVCVGRSRGGGSGRRRGGLAYELPDDSRHERWISATREEWETLKDGEPVDLVYLEDRPKVFATLRLVNLAREAKGLAPIS
jgi:hypothetical protein